MSVIRVALATAGIVVLGAAPAVAAYVPSTGSVTVTPSACVYSEGTQNVYSDVTVSGTSLTVGATATITIVPESSSNAGAWTPSTPTTATVGSTGQFSSVFTFTKPGAYDVTVVVGARTFGPNVVNVLDTTADACVLGEKFSQSPSPSPSSTPPALVSAETLPKTGAGNALPLALAGGLLLVGGGALVAAPALGRRRRH